MSLDLKYSPIETTKSTQLLIDRDGSVRSNRFSDIYFNPSEGYQESKYVYIEGNQLSERWSQLFETQRGQAHFTIAEIGFGTGLNFLAAAEEWQNQILALPQSEQPHKTLYYYGIEKHPLTRIALKKLIEKYNPLPSFASKLIRLYPDVKGGSYLLDFSILGLNIKLILLFGEADKQLELLENYSLTRQIHPSGNIDAWFLDGFSPSENQDMWSEAIFQRIASNSKTDTSVATFSVAAPVKKGLSQNGFVLEKKPGFRKKREMLTAKLNQNTAAAETSSFDQNSTQNSEKNKRQPENLRRCYSRSTDANNETQSIAIIGAGIAGCTLANCLAKKGASVTIYDSASKVAQGASGNNVAVLHSKIFKERSLLADFTEAALHHAKNCYAEQSTQNDIHLGQYLWQPLSNPSHAFSTELTTGEFEYRFASNNPLSSESLAKGICFEGIAGLKPDLLCPALINELDIALFLNTKVRNIEAKDGNEKKCRVTHEDGQIKEYDAVVIASGSASRDLLSSSSLPLRNVRGQTTSIYLPNAAFASEETIQQLASMVLCGQGYLLTERLDRKTVGLHYGATYEPNSSDRCNSPIDALNNLDNIADLLATSPPSLLAYLRLMPLLRSALLKSDEKGNSEPLTIESEFGSIRIENRSEIRSATPDYLPVAGPLADTTAFYADYKTLGKNARQQIECFAKYQNGLYIFSGLGSNGFSTAPLLSELLASDILGHPYPVSEDIRQALSPQRFLIRDIIRGRS